MAYIPRISRERLANDAVDTTKVENGSLTGDDLELGAIGTDQLGDDAVTGDKIAPLAVGNDHLGDQVVDARVIADETITNQQVATGAAIEFSKLEADPRDRALHTGTQTADTISDFDNQVNSHRLDEFQGPTNPVSLNSQRITDLGEPENPGDAVNKAYADALAAGLDPKESVAYTTTGNVNLSGLAAQANGTWPGTMPGPRRILVKDQTDSSENGIYVSAAGAWARSEDFNGDPEAEVSNGAFTLVAGADGTSLVGTGWIVTTGDTIVVGSNGIDWAMFSMPGQASYLDDLLDVDTTTVPPTDGAVLFLDTDDNTWKPSGTLTVEPEGVVTVAGDTYLNGEVLVDGRSHLRALNTTIQVLSANHNVNTQVDHTLVFNTNAAARTATLPAADGNDWTLGAGDQVVLKRSGVNPLVVTTADGANIDGVPDDFVFDIDLMAITFVFDGTGWWVF